MTRPMTRPFGPTRRPRLISIVGALALVAGLALAAPTTTIQADGQRPPAPRGATIGGAKPAGPALSGAPTQSGSFGPKAPSPVLIGLLVP